MNKNSSPGPFQFRTSVSGIIRKSANNEPILVDPNNQGPCQYRKITRPGAPHHSETSVAEYLPNSHILILQHSTFLVHSSWFVNRQKRSRCYPRTYVISWLLLSVNSWRRFKLGENGRVAASSVNCKGYVSRRMRTYNKRCLYTTEHTFLGGCRMLFRRRYIPRVFRRRSIWIPPDASYCKDAIPH